MPQTPTIIDVTTIVDRDSFNPRDEIEKKALDQLTKSIQQQGLLQPPIVRPIGEGYAIIDGHRRVAASINAGEFQILALVQTEDRDEADDLVTAVIANQVRVGLNPVEEAKAYRRLKDEGRSARQIASELTISEKLVKERLALLELPDEILALVGSGEVPLGAMSTLNSIAKVCPPAALEVAVLAAENHRTANQIIDAPLYQVQAPDEKAGWLVIHNFTLPEFWTYNADQTALDKEATKLRGWSERLSLRDTVDEAVKIGIGWSVNNEHGVPTTAVISDTAWLIDHTTRRLESIVKALKAQIKKRIEAGDVPNGLVADENGAIREADESELKDQRKDEREQQRRDQANARGANHALGVALYTKTKLREIDKPMMLQLAKLLIQPEYGEIAQAGPAQCQERYLERPEKENGAYGFKYRQAAEEMWGFIEEGQTPEEVLQRLMMVLAQAECANLASLPQSRQVRRPALMERAGEVARWYCQEALPAELRVRKLPEPRVIFATPSEEPKSDD